MGLVNRYSSFRTKNNFSISDFFKLRILNKLSHIILIIIVITTCKLFMAKLKQSGAIVLLSLLILVAYYIFDEQDLISVTEVARYKCLEN